MICTPFFAASSIMATCLSTIRFLMFSRLLSAGSSLAACINPHRTIRDIAGSSPVCRDCPVCGGLQTHAQTGQSTLLLNARQQFCEMLASGFGIGVFGCDFDSFLELRF